MSSTGKAAPPWALLLVSLLVVAVVIGGVLPGTQDVAEATPSISQTYFTPFEAQELIDILRSILSAGGSCTGPVHSTISITSGADANTVYYDHFEDGYEVDPINPVQGSTLTMVMDVGDVWTQSSNVPVDQPGRGAGNYYDGRDRIVSTAPIAVTQAVYADSPGELLAGAVQVLDVDKSGIQFDLPVGEDVDFNQVFEYVGVVLVGTEFNTQVQIDADADGSFETSTTLNLGQTYVIDGGVDLGAQVTSDRPISAYVTTGDVAANYESRFFELYPTSIWSDEIVSPVGARSSAETDDTRVFLFNPSTDPITVTATTAGGGTTDIPVSGRGQASYLMPQNQGALFSTGGGELVYGFQASTTGSSSASYDWGFTLVPENAATPSTILPYAPGSADGSKNYSPVWVATFADTRIYIDLDGDPTTGAGVDPFGDQYDFHCDVVAYASTTVYDDGQGVCYLPSADANQSGGDHDMTGSRIYTTDGTRLIAAWGQRAGYAAGTPALDMGTTILPFPSINMAKTSVVSNDVDLDGEADPGDTITYSITMENNGIIDVGAVLVFDETPSYTSYVADSTTLDGVPVADDVAPFTPNPLDSDSPDGGLDIDTIAAGATRIVTFSIDVDDPVALGVRTVGNHASMSSAYGPSSAMNVIELDVPPLQIDKTSIPDSSPVGSGETIDYRIRVFNGDDASQTGVSLVDAIPAGTTYVPGSISGDVDGTPVVVNDPPNIISGLTLASGEIMTVNFSVTVDAPIVVGVTEFANSATADSDQYDPVLANVSDPADPQADLSLAKDDDTAVTMHPGETLTYTLTVTNNGPDVADGPVIVDTLPAGVTFDDVASDPLCVEGPVGTIACSLADLAPGSTAVDIVVAINAGVDGTITNNAVVSASTPDPNGGNNSASVDTPVDALPSITVTKDASVASVPETGGTVTFSVDVDNDSAEAGTLTVLADDLFGDLLDVGNVLVSNNTCPGADPAIPALGTFSCSFDAVISGDFGGADHVNTVTATVEDDETNSTTDSDDATVTFTDVPGTLTGHLFVDTDEDGVQDPGEPDLPNVSVSVTDGNGVTGTVTSNGAGDWTTSVGAGSVTAQVVAGTVPAGYVLTTANASQTVTVDPGETVASEDVGYRPPKGELSGTIFFDVDGDDLLDAGEPRFLGIVVDLLDDLGATIDSTTTAADGSYEFTEVPGAEYTIAVDARSVPAGFALTLDPDGTEDGETTVMLPADTTIGDLDFAYRGTGSIGDTVWYDLDGDGEIDFEEEPLPGVTVSLVWSGSDGVLDSVDDVQFPSQVSGVNGEYLFTGVPPGLSRMAVTDADEELEPTTAEAIIVTLGAGQAFLDADVGYVSDDELPYTGLDVQRLLWTAALLIYLGLVILGFDRRRDSGHGLA